MSKETMSLKMRILATGAQALGELDKVSKSVRAAGQDMKAIGGIAGGGLNLFLKPLKIGASVAAGFGAIVAALGTKALLTAASYESLQLRLEAVAGSVQKAKKIFAETNIMAMRTPFQLDELVNARILLEGIGVQGIKALESVGNAAAAMGRSVNDVASMVASMETEPLRRMGIQLKRDGENFEFSFRDRMGRMRKVTANTAQDAQKSLLKIFDVKAGGAMLKLADSIAGKWSTLKDVANAAFKQFGEGLMGPGKDLLDSAIATINKLIDSKVLEKWGKQLGEYLSDKVKDMKALLMVLEEAWNQIKSAGPATLGSIILTALSAGAEMLAYGFLDMLAASGSIWMGIGKIIAAVFIEQFLQLPGMGAARKSMMGEKYRGMSFEDRWQFAKDNNLPLPERGSVGAPADYSKMLAAINASPELQAKLAGGGGKELFTAGVAQAMDALPGLMQNLKGRGQAALREIDKTTAQQWGGWSFTGAFDRNRAALEPQPAFSSTDYLKRKSMIGPMSERYRPTGMYINNVQVYANDAGEFTRSIVDYVAGSRWLTTMPQMNAAGG